MKKCLSKKWLAIPAMTLAMAVSHSAFAQAYINVTAGGAFAPGVYGQISIGNNPPPPVINMQPIIGGQPLYGVAPPMYLNVPPEQYRDWDRYCGAYRACGYPVHFVQMDPRNPWWARHGEHLRGRDAYRAQEGYRGGRGEHNGWGGGDHGGDRGDRGERH